MAVLQEGTKEFRLALQGLAGTASGRGQATQGGRGMVGQGVLFEIAPGIFHGIQFRGVGREVFQIEAQMAVEKRCDLASQVGTGTIPDHQDVSPQLAEKLAQEVEGAIGIDVPVGMEPEVEVEPVAGGRHGQRANAGDFLIRPAALVEDRGLAPRSPSPAHQRGHQKAGFVQENQVRPQPAGFFLMRGHSLLIQRRMARSLRSAPRRSGFWGVQPRERNNRQTPETA